MDRDEEAAKVVQRIFNLCIAGKGPMQIAKNPHSRQGADRLPPITPGRKAGHAGESMPLEYQRPCLEFWSGGSTRAVP